jgi:hypothetical protein
VVAKEVGAAPDDRRDWRRDLGGGNRTLLASAKQDRLESGATVRLDSTVSAALMHEPSDSTLLCDGVRVMTRLLRRADALTGGQRHETRPSPPSERPALRNSTGAAA